MKRTFFTFVISSLWLSLLPGAPAQAQQQAQTVSIESDDGAVVCAPAYYETDPGNCLPLGPSQTISEYASLGIQFPLRNLPAVTPDGALNHLPYRYYKITEPFAPLYPSLDAAIEKTGASRQIGPGEFMYVIYNQVVETPKRGTYFQLPSGEWMPGVGERVSVPVFQGLQFLRTPGNAFGWVITDAEVRSLPDYNASVPVLTTLRPKTLVQVYKKVTVENINWLLIGPDQWVDARRIGVVYPNTTPPAGVTGDRWIEVNLFEQTLAVYEKRQLVFATIIASGAEPLWTRPGLFQIYQKKELETMSGATTADRSDYYYLENVPYTMYFDKARAIHGAYWRSRLGFPQSHGCVNMSVGDSAWVFQWAKEGDWVYVHDPSGKTPTDPAIYGDGGA